MKFVRNTRILNISMKLIANPEISLLPPVPILPHPHFTENFEKQAKWARKSHSLFSQ